jgi:succinate dehydrogenase/fumarate reductase flavoprotein subunit
MHLPIDLLGSGGRLRKESGEDAGPEAVFDGEGCVLDLRSLDATASPWFTQTTRRVRERAGLDIATEVIPLSPSVAATTGGAPVDESGRVTFDDGSMWVTGLYAAGRSANTGMHGAGMLPGNQLLEDLVTGNSAGEHAGAWASNVSFGGSSLVEGAIQAEQNRVASLMRGDGESVGRVSTAMSSVMSNLNGTRDERALEAAATSLAGLREKGIGVTDPSMVMNTELVTAIHLEGMFALAEAIIGSEG